MTFRIVDTALEGFRLTGAHPRAVALWAVLCVVMNLATIATLISIAGPAIGEMATMNANGAAESDPTTAFRLLGQMMAAYAAIIPLSLIIMSVLVNAVFRASAFPTQGAFGFVRLGADEFRLIVVYLVLGVLSVVGGIVLMIPLSILMGATAMSGGVERMMIGLLVVYAVLFLVWMFWYTRMSFAAPMTLLQKRINIFGSWKATNGRFWALFGCNLLATVLAVVVMILGVAVGMGAMAGFGGSFDKVISPDMSSLAAYFTPGMTAYMIIAGLFWALAYVIFFAPSMAAYRAIHGVGADEVSRNFD